MNPLVSIIMGSTSDLPVMEKACKLLDELQVPFEVNALSAHRTPDAVEQFAKGAKDRGLKVIIAGAGMAAALPGVIAASTTLPVIGVPIKGMLDGLDAMLSIIQMPPGIPVATVGVNAAANAAIRWILFNCHHLLYSYSSDYIRPPHQKQPGQQLCSLPCVLRRAPPGIVLLTEKKRDETRFFS